MARPAGGTVERNGERLHVGGPADKHGAGHGAAERPGHAAALSPRAPILHIREAVRERTPAIS